jgi:hypothetical protein
VLLMVVPGEAHAVARELGERLAFAQVGQDQKRLPISD